MSCNGDSGSGPMAMDLSSRPGSLSAYMDATAQMPPHLVQAHAMAVGGVTPFGALPPHAMQQLDVAPPIGAPFGVQQQQQQPTQQQQQQQPFGGGPPVFGVGLDTPGGHGLYGGGVAGGPEHGQPHDANGARTHVDIR